MTTFDIRLFGAIEIRRDGELLTDFRSQKALVLLAYLICENRPVTRDYLAGLGWPEMEQSQALGLLRRSLHDLNSQLPGCLEIDRRTVCFNPSAPATVDIHQLADLMARNDLDAWAASASLYRAPFLHGVYVDDAPELESWLLHEQERWQGDHIRLLNMLATYHTERAAYPEALDFTQQVLAIEPWREEAHRQAMLLLARVGQTSAALAQYETCHRTLYEELDVEPADETKNLQARIAAMAHTPAHPLPTATTLFVGRTAELAELTQLLASGHCRLITLVGSGGMGKTRLAIETARSVSSDQRRLFLHGVYFVALVGVDTLTQFVSALGQALAVTFQAQRTPETQLLHYLRDKELLLILDNFEQLVNAPILVFIRQLLDTAPDSKLLITSRIRLHLQSEQIYWLQGLHVPVTTTATTTLSLTETTTYSSIQLFLTTVRRGRPRYTLSTDDAPAVMTICQLVQGMPLAIELAAAWMSVLTPSEIAAELARNLDFLASEAHDLPLRQRSMRAVFDTSWRLLTETERAVFQQLTVFRGGFTSEAAQAVTKAPLAALVGLVHKTFLYRTPADRFEVHELLRQYGAEQLHAIGAMDMMRERHLSYFLALAETAESELSGIHCSTWLARLEKEHDNLGAALAWSEGSPLREQGWRCAGALWLYWYDSHRLLEGVAWLGKVLENENVPAAVRAKALYGSCMLLEQLGNNHQKVALAHRSLLLCRTINDAVGTALSLLCLHVWMHFQGNHQQARAMLEEAITLLRAAHHHWGVGFALLKLSRLLIAQGEMGQAASSLEESIALSKAMKINNRIVEGLAGFTRLALAKGDLVQAKRLTEQNLAMARAEKFTLSICHALHMLASIVLQEGNYARATELLEKELVLWRGNDYASGKTVWALASLGAAARVQGDYTTAAKRFDEVTALYAETEEDSGMGYLHLGRGYLALAQLDEKAAVAAFVASLRLAHKMKYLPLGALAIVAIAQLLERHGDIAHCAQLCGFAAPYQPVVFAELLVVERMEYARTIIDMQSRLNDPSLAAAWRAGASMSFNEAMTKALIHLGVSQPEDE